MVDPVPFGGRSLRRSARAIWHLPQSIAAGVRHRKAFASVEHYCMFIGTPRSGHTLLGAFLNAHPNALIAHEQDALQDLRMGYGRLALYGRLHLRDEWFEARGRQWTGYDYAIETHTARGPLRVIGDKRGGDSTCLLHEQPGLLQRLRDTVGIPIRVVHHVRNPFDNIATIATRRGASLDQAIEGYFWMARANQRILDELLAPEERIPSRHEDLVATPHRELPRILGLLGLHTPSGYVEGCAAKIFDAPARSRTKCRWSDEQVARVEREIAHFPSLVGYRFEVPGAAATEPA